MKKALPFFLLLWSQAVFSQKYLDDITNKTCKCIQKLKDSVKIEEKMKETRLGLCMIEAASPYQKELKKDFKINLYNMNEKEGEKLGQALGLKMAAQCPDIILYMSGEIEEVAAPVSSLTTDGEITRIQDEQFVCFTLDERNGKLSNYYWLEPFENSEKLMNSYKNKLGKIVTITYLEKEVFDPRISEYRKLKVISKLEER